MDINPYSFSIRKNMDEYTVSSVKDTAMRQYARLLDRAGEQLGQVTPPAGGWIAAMRKALGMSAPALARRLGVTKAAVYQAERKELEGGVTLQHMEKLAEALGGRFVYAIVPEGSVEEMLEAQARSKAESIIRRASAHMALEQQSLTQDQIQAEIGRLSSEILRERPSDFWEKP